jgi:hypothetical protein
LVCEDRSLRCWSSADWLSARLLSMSVRRSSVFLRVSEMGETRSARAFCFSVSMGVGALVVALQGLAGELEELLVGGP